MGFPIRTSPDHSSVDSSPRLIAASYVLLRLLVPRHPPSALSNLTTDISRCSRSLCSSQGTGEGTFWFDIEPSWSLHEVDSRPFPQDPTACQATCASSEFVPRPYGQYLIQAMCLRPTSQCFHFFELLVANVRRFQTLDHEFPRGQMLLRKEVIQPHLPVRLPCYDFVPIASPTFDSSLHKGWATGFGCYRLS